MLLLASKSPRRSELLRQLGQPFTQIDVDVDETPIASESPVAYVERLALAKAQAGLSLAQPGDQVLGLDTCVVIDEVILGKPADRSDALAMLSRLSGRTHQVYTGVALVSQEGESSEVVCTDVSFTTLSEQDMADYWATGEPADKAGSYGIQGIGGKFVKQIKGSYSAVVGLPLYETDQLIQQARAE